MPAGARVSWTEVDGHACLLVQFAGRLDVDAARDAAREICEILAARSEPVPMIWDASAMTGYQKEARDTWMEQLATVRDRVHSTHLVAGAAVVRMGAAVVGMFLGTSITTWPDLESVRIR